MMYVFSRSLVPLSQSFDSGMWTMLLRKAVAEWYEDCVLIFSGETMEGRTFYWKIPGVTSSGSALITPAK